MWKVSSEIATGYTGNPCTSCRLKHKGSAFLILQCDNTGVAGGFQQPLKIKLHYTGTERCSLILSWSWSHNATFWQAAESHCALMRAQVQTMQQAASLQPLPTFSGSQQFYGIMSEAGCNCISLSNIKLLLTWRTKMDTLGFHFLCMSKEITEKIHHFLPLAERLPHLYFATDLFSSV